MGLPLDLGEIHVVGGVLTLRGFRLHARRLDRSLAGQPLDRLAQASKGEGREVPHYSGLTAVGGGKEEAVEPFAATGERDREDASYRLDLAVE